MELQGSFRWLIPLKGSGMEGRIVASLLNRFSCHLIIIEF